MPRTISEIAVESGLLARTAASRVPALATEHNEPAICVLVRHLEVNEIALAAALGRATRLPVLDPATTEVDAEAIRLIAQETCQRLKVIPISVETIGPRQHAIVAMADPTDAAAIAEVDAQIGGEISIAILPLATLEAFIERAYRGYSTAVVKSRAKAAPLGLRPLYRLVDVLVRRQVLTHEEAAEIMRQGED